MAYREVWAIDLACPSCGADARLRIGSKALVCASCGKQNRLDRTQANLADQYLSLMRAAALAELANWRKHEKRVSFWISLLVPVFLAFGGFLASQMMPRIAEALELNTDELPSVQLALFPGLVIGWVAISLLAFLWRLVNAPPPWSVVIGRARCNKCRAWVPVKLAHGVTQCPFCTGKLITEKIFARRIEAVSAGDLDLARQIQKGE